MSASPDPARTDPTPLPAVRREVLLAADRDAVWRELSDPNALSGWLADEVDVAVEPGATGTVRDAGGPERPVRVESVEPGRRLSLVWGGDADGETLVELTLRPDDADPDRTRLVVVEVPVATLSLVAPAADRLLVSAGRPGVGGAGAPTASAVLAGCR